MILKYLIGQEVFGIKFFFRGPELGRVIEEAGGGVCLHQSMCVAYLSSQIGRKPTAVVTGFLPSGDRHAINLFYIATDKGLVPFVVDVASGIKRRMLWYEYLSRFNFSPQSFEWWFPK